MVDDNKSDYRISVRVPQYLKDKVVEEAQRLSVGQSDIVRMILSIYFEEKGR